MGDFLVLGIPLATFPATFTKKSLKVLAITAGSVVKFPLTSLSLLITLTFEFLLLKIDFDFLDIFLFLNDQRTNYYSKINKIVNVHLMLCLELPWKCYPLFV